MYIGIDIGGTKVKYGLVDELGNVTQRGAMSTSHQKEPFIQELIQLIQQFQGARADIRGIGISAPGIIKKNGLMTTAGAIKTLYGTNLKEEIESAVHLPVCIENDANAAAIAERWIGNAQHIENYLCIVLGTGIGGGIVINGDVYRGGHGMAGEFGWMMIDRLPAEGELESVSLNQRAAIVGGLCLRFNQKMQAVDTDFEPTYDAKSIFEQEATNPIAAEIIRQFFEDLATGLLNLISCFDPEVVLIGGGVSENEIFFQRLEEEVDRLGNRHSSIAYLKDQTIAPIRQAKLKNDAGLIGAVFQVHQLLANEKIKNVFISEVR
jgi:hypothetical protein